jgi:hypothetical protein
VSAGQDPAQDPARTALERRYLRLLRCYPPGHRQAHREEMLGVLLAAARPGQRAPGLTQALNLAVCGLAIRARRILLAGPWQDALAVVSLIVPVLMLISSVLDLAQTAREIVAADQQYPPTVPFWQLDNLPQLAGPTAVLIAWLAVVILASAGRRRTAAAIACVPLALDLATMLTGVLQQSGGLTGGLPELLWMAGLGPVIPASLAACSLAFSPGPRRGLAIAGPRRACLILAGLAGVYGAALVVRLVNPFASVTSPAFRLLDVLVLVVAVALLCLPGTARVRVGALLASGLVLDLAGTPFGDNQTATVVVMLGNVMIALLVWPVAIASWKGRPGGPGRREPVTAPAARPAPPT